MNSIEQICNEALEHFNNQLYKNALDNFKLIVSKGVFSRLILKYIANIYIMFDNYVMAEKYVNVSIEYFNNVEDYKLKCLILKQKSPNLLNDFLTDSIKKFKNNDLLFYFVANYMKDMKYII